VPAGLGANDVRNITLQINAVDNASQVINKVGGNVNQAFAQFGKGMVLQKIGTELTQIGRKMNDVTRSAVEMALDFNRSMQSVQTQAQLSKKQFDAVTAGAIEIAKRFGQGTETIAEGLYDIFSSTEVSYKGALRMVQGYARAATAGATDVRTVSRSAIATMNALGFTARDTQYILDNQFQAVRKGVFTYEEFASSIGNVLPYGASANQMLETLTGSMAFMSRQGFTAAQSSISVARALDQVTRNRGDIRDAIGVDIVDKATGEYKQLGEIIDEFSRKMDGMTSSEREEAFQDMFGAGEIRAMRFFRVAVPRQDLLNKLIGEMGGPQVAGQMKKAFDIMKESPAVQWSILLERIKAIGVELGTLLLPIVEDFIKLLRQVVEWFDNLSPSAKKWIAIGFAVAGIIITISGVVLTLIGSFLLLQSILTLTGVALGTIVGIVAGVIIAIAALVAIGYLLIKNWDTIKEWASTVWDYVTERVLAMWHTVEPTIMAIWEIIKVVMGYIWGFIKTIWGAILAYWEGVWGIFRAVFKAAWTIFYAFWKTVWDILWIHLKGIWSGIQLAWRLLWPAIKAVWVSVGKPIFDAVKAVWTTVWDFLRDNWDKIKSAWQTLWDGIKATFFGIVNSIIGGIEGFVNAIIKAINWVRTKFGLDEIALVVMDRVGLSRGSYGSGSGDTSAGALANGTTNWRGGWATVGERGPELAYLPRGSRVVPNKYLPGFAEGLDIPDAIWSGAKSGLQVIPGAGFLTSIFSSGFSPGELFGDALSAMGVRIPDIPTVFKDITVKFLADVRGWMATAIKEMIANLVPQGGAGAWGGFSNGMIPLGAMTQVQPGKYLEPMAAMAFKTMQGAYGTSIPITSAYRSYALQASMYANRASNPYPVAPPGTSNHGWGKAVDIASGTSYHGWMLNNARNFGWWNLPGDLPHFDYKGMNMGGSVVKGGWARLHSGESIRPARTISDYRQREKQGEFHLHIEPTKAVIDENEIVNELDWMRRTRGW